MNLFWSTRRVTEAREEHLTEFFAAALSQVPSFRQAYADLVLRDFAVRTGWSAPVIDVVGTQPECPGTGCRRDKVLRLAGKPYQTRLDPPPADPRGAHPPRQERV